jgi:hypothetical protein
MNRLAHAAAFAALAAGAIAQAPTVTTVVNNGPTASRYDMVILGDGYQAGQQALFNQHVNTFLTALFQRAPYNVFAPYFNVHTVFRASVDSGADRPDENPPVFRNTVYDATYNFGGVDRCLYIQNTSQALADAALAPATEGRVLVMVNDTRYGGCASTFAVSYTGGSMSEVQIHELGHSLGALADEYDYPNQTYGGGEPGQANITASPVGQKWSAWWGTDGISAFQGAGYYLFGLYRPKQNCLMRSLGQALCRVCQEGIVKVVNGVVDTITSTQPAATSVTVSAPNQQTFSFSHIVPPGNAPLIAWKLDGVTVPGATGLSWTLDSATVALGTHTVECSVLDQSPLVRNDSGLVMRETHTWNVTVANPNAAQLRVPQVATPAIYVPAGASAAINATIANDGPAAAGPFDVEYFLSPTTTWSPQTSVYLGKTTVNLLAAGQQVTVPYTATLPWRLPAAVTYGFVVVDRLDTVLEGNENDNVRNFVFLVQAPPCGPRLEFRDPLVYPPDAASLARTAGGAVQPTIVARCANPATTLYLIAWGGSGTSPGAPLAPGVTLPLNPDGLTSLGLDALNGPVFGAFLGVLDAQGIGRATFTLPPGLALPTGATHFAGVLLGNPQLFQATTNPVALTLTP